MRDSERQGAPPGDRASRHRIAEPPARARERSGTSSGRPVRKQSPGTDAVRPRGREASSEADRSLRRNSGAESRRQAVARPGSPKLTPASDAAEEPVLRDGRKPAREARGTLRQQASSPEAVHGARVGRWNRGKTRAFQRNAISVRGTRGSAPIRLPRMLSFGPHSPLRVLRLGSTSEETARKRRDRGGRLGRKRLRIAGETESC